jgi:nicotinate-nucleotide adenylyltransferase
MAQNGGSGLARSPHPTLALAVFGGTFNPVHLGHLLMAETALQQFALEQILWVPSYYPFYKTAPDLLSFEHRVEMLRRAIASHPQFILSTIEQAQPYPVYAIDTFLALQAQYPDSSWSWVLGLDAFRSLPRWYRHQELAPRCRWLVAPRWTHSCQNGGIVEPNAATEPAGYISPSVALCQQVADRLARESIHLTWHLLDMPRLDISSSLIRRYCGDRRSVRYLVPESVRLYIHEHQLYQR